MNELLAVAGRLHPLLLHLPIGFVAALAALETLGALRRSPPPLAVMATLTRLTQLAAAAAITTGLLLEQEGGYPEALADQHRNAGLAFFVVSLAMGRFARRSASRWRSRSCWSASPDTSAAASRMAATSCSNRSKTKRRRSRL